MTVSTAMDESQDRQASFGGVQARASTSTMNEPRIAIRNLEFLLRQQPRIEECAAWIFLIAR